MGKKEEHCKKEIKKKYGELNKGFKTMTEIQVQLGQLFITLKGIVHKDEKQWENYVKKNFQYMTIRTVQRWIKLGEAVKLDKYPQLAYAGQTRLLALAKIANREGSKIHSLLEDNEILPKKEPKSSSELRSFKDQIDGLIKQNRGRAKTQTSAAKIFKRLINTAKELSRELDYHDASKTISRDNIDKSIDELEELLEKLEELREEIKSSKNSSKKSSKKDSKKNSKNGSKKSSKKGSKKSSKKMKGKKSA